MLLSPQQLEEFDRDGFLIFPGMFSREEVAALVRECDRLGGIEADYIKRERGGALRTIFRVHEDNGPTQSPEFRALSRSPRLMVPGAQMLRDDAMFIFHTKINFKPAFEGTIWAWHQDYGTWEKDGLPTANIVTVLVMLDDADEMGARSISFRAATSSAPSRMSRTKASVR
jgi:ectoine hydroxylase